MRLIPSSTGSQGGTISVTDTIPLTIVGSTAASPDISVSLPTNQGAPENQWYTFSGDTGNPIVVNADPTANAIVTVTTSNADLSLGLTDGSGDSIATLTGTVADINTELDGLEFSPLAYGTAQLTVTAILVDASGNPASAPTSASTTVNVRQAPYFNAYLPLWLQDQPESTDDTYSSGFININLDYYCTPISDVLNQVPGSSTDPSGPDANTPIGNQDPPYGPGVYGIAITGLDTQDGTWQYSPDGGIAFDGATDWQDIGAVSDTNALLLDSTDSIRFVPNPGYFGDISDAITFLLWDGSTGTSMTYADVSDNGGITAFSADSATAALRVDPLVSISGGGGQYTISTTSAVPAALDVSGTAGWDESYSLGLPFTVTIPAGQSSTTLNLSNFASDDDWYYYVGQTTSAFTVGLATPGSIYGTPIGYDYVVDQSAGSVSTTATANPDNQPGAATYSQSGNTIQVTLDNAAGTAAMSWSTADGTAIAGTDYQSASGSVPAGQSETVSITLDNLNAPGDSGFYIVTSGGGLSGNYYDPVVIQTVGLQLLADSNNDGRIDATSDAAANATALSSGSGGLFLWPNNNAASGGAVSGQALIASGQLAEVDLVFNDVPGASITLSAQGDTQDFIVWTSPALTTQIVLTGSGATWPADTAPTQVWIQSLAAGSETLVAQLTGPGSSGSAPQKLAISSGGQVIFADTINGNQKDVTGLLQHALNSTQGAFVPLDDGDDVGHPESVSDLVTAKTGPVNGELDLLPIVLKQNGTVAANAGTYFLTIPANVNVYMDPDCLGLVHDTTPIPASADTTLYVQGAVEGVGTIVVNWTGPQGQVRKSVDALQVTVFAFNGPRTVPNYSDYVYSVATPAPASTWSTTVQNGTLASDHDGDLEVLWGAGAVVGIIAYNASANYSWDMRVNIISITISSPSTSATVSITDDSYGTLMEAPPGNPTPNATWLYVNSSQPADYSIYLDAYMTVRGPGANGTNGVGDLQYGFVQTALQYVDIGTYADGTVLSSNLESNMPALDSLANDPLNPPPWLILTQAFVPARGGVSGEMIAGDGPGVGMPLYSNQGNVANPATQLSSLDADVVFQTNVVARPIEDSVYNTNPFTTLAYIQWQYNGSGFVGPGGVWTPNEDTGTWVLNNGFWTPTGAGASWTLVTDGSKPLITGPLVNSLATQQAFTPAN